MNPEEFNLNVIKPILKEKGATSLRELYKKDLCRDYAFQKLLKCVVCGNDWKITFKILDFFDYDIGKIICHNCQNNNRIK